MSRADDVPDAREVHTVAEIHHFTYGWFNPIAAYLMAFLGSMLGLAATARARQARTRGRQARWLVMASVSIGGSGVWLMHFMAMLGFDVPGATIRYDPILTLGSMLLAVVPVGIGLFLVSRAPAGTGGSRPFSWDGTGPAPSTRDGEARRHHVVPRVLGGGLFTGLGVFAMHYTGMLGMRVAGTIYFDPGLVAASGLVAVVAATAALWFATAVRGWAPILAASLVMGVAICGMHYTGMAAMRVRLSPEPVEISGISPFLLIVPITVLAAVALVTMAISALQAMTEEEFDGAVTGRKRGGRPDATAEPGPLAPWTAGTNAGGRNATHDPSGTRLRTGTASRLAQGALGRRPPAPGVNGPAASGEPANGVPGSVAPTTWPPVNTAHVTHIADSQTGDVHLDQVQPIGAHLMEPPLVEAQLVEVPFRDDHTGDVTGMGGAGRGGAGRGWPAGGGSGPAISGATGAHGTIG